MNLSKRVRLEIQALCGSINEDDCIDGRDYHDRRQHAVSQCVRQLRLCSTVRKTLDSLLHESRDPIIAELQLVDVTPAPRGNVLVVSFRRNARTQHECSSALEALRQQRGWLRAEIASRVTRKQVPNLSFEFVNIEEGGQQV